MLLVPSIARRALLVFTAALVTLFFPGFAFADEAGGATTDPTTTQTTGPNQPTGAESKTYHFNTETGKWENDHYIWDPVTKKTTPKNSAYVYNPETGKWDTSSWKYDAPSQRYNEVKTPAPTTANPAIDTSNTGSDTPNSQHSSAATAVSDSQSATAAAIANDLVSTAVSGNATVAHNTLGGNAQSGSATITSNTVNMLQSSMALSGTDSIPIQFTKDITEDHIGDLLLDPSLFIAQPASNCCASNNINVAIQNEGTITNTIDLDAASGDASVLGNTSAGNATSGAANAVANVINMANSAISASGAFLGVINIYADLDGDILLPTQTLDILASNAPPVTLDTSTMKNGELLANFANSQNVTNNVNAFAASGNATVASNTQAGSAKTGNASTNITVLNLTGHEVIGSSSLLVFVNVLGSWLGFIVDEPAGTTAAALGGGVTSSSCACNGVTNIESSNQANITNNITVKSVSGDATVANNTEAGNSTSGDASASANILNVANTSMSLDDWFGVLFINVFGSWNGSFGKDTEAGEQPQAATANPGNASTMPTLGAPEPPKTVFRLTATGNGNYSVNSLEQDESNGVASASTEQNVKPPTISLGAKTSSVNWEFISLGLLISACLVAIERARALHQQKIKNIA